MKQTSDRNAARPPSFRVQQTGSPIRRHWSQRATLIGLGLNRIGRIARVPDTVATWGMIRKVAHLVTFPDLELLEQHRMAPPRVANEDEDVELLKKLVFNQRNVLLHRFKKKEMRKPTPDFKLFKDGTVQGYCEIKSPNDTWLFDFPEDLQPGELREEQRPAPAVPNLAMHIEKAAEQFNSVNPDHALPNIMVIVNHAPLRGPIDLRLALEGLELPDGRRAILVHDKNEKVPGQRQRRVWDAARTIDLYVWIDANKGTVEYRQPIGAKRLAEACDLVGIKQEQPAPARPV